MGRDSLYKLDPLDDLAAGKVRDQEGSSFDDNDDNLGLPDPLISKHKTRKYSNHKNYIIGFVGAALIGYMVYNLLTNYLGLM